MRFWRPISSTALSASTGSIRLWTLARSLGWSFLSKVFSSRNDGEISSCSGSDPVPAAAIPGAKAVSWTGPLSPIRLLPWLPSEGRGSTMTERAGTGIAKHVQFLGLEHQCDMVGGHSSISCIQSFFKLIGMFLFGHFTTCFFFLHQAAWRTVEPKLQVAIAMFEHGHWLHWTCSRASPLGRFQREGLGSCKCRSLAGSARAVDRIRRCPMNSW